MPRRTRRVSAYSGVEVCSGRPVVTWLCVSIDTYTADRVAALYSPLRLLLESVRRYYQRLTEVWCWTGGDLTEACRSSHDRGGLVCWGQRLSLLGGCQRVSLQLPVQVSSDIGHRLLCAPDTVYLCAHCFISMFQTYPIK